MARKNRLDIGWVLLVVLVLMSGVLIAIGEGEFGQTKIFRFVTGEVLAVTAIISGFQAGRSLRRTEPADRNPSKTTGWRKLVQFGPAVVAFLISLFCYAAIARMAT